MVQAGQRNMNIDLHIKSLSMKVGEHTPVFVTWQRGSKMAKTKSRLLNETINSAVIDEKFQINTVMDVDADGNPTKAKKSKLIVNGDKGKGVLGEAELNLSDYSEGEFKVLRLPLRNCADPDAVIEVGLKGSQAKERKEAPSTPKETQNAEESKEQIIHALDDLDKEKKNQKRLKLEYEEKVRGLNEKVNNLQTTLENTKTELQFLQKQSKGFS